jgi:DNA (cytosine-5)-methyltransferase 1
MPTTLLNKNRATRKPKRPRRFRAAEFFAGIGLVRLALEKQNWEVVFANDIDPKKLKMYADNFGEEHFKLGDIHQIDPEEVPDCELFTASFP